MNIPKQVSLISNVYCFAGRKAQAVYIASGHLLCSSNSKGLMNIYALWNVHYPKIYYCPLLIANFVTHIYYYYTTTIA